MGDLVLSTPTFPGQAAWVDIDGLIPLTAVTAAVVFANDERLLRSDGAGRGAQASVATLSDSGIMANLAQLGIGTGAIDASALLQLDSTTQGFLEPRMTEAQRDGIGSPATGLQVYNTDTDLLNYFNGVSWASLATTGPQTFVVVTTGASSDTTTLGAADIYAATANDITITIQTADITQGRQFILKDQSGTASVSCPIVVATEGAQTIDGAASASIIAPFGSVSLYVDGGNLFSK